jgi:hypothetical protein
MKNFVGKIFVGSNAKFNVLLVLCLFAFVGLGCFGSGKNKDAKPIPAAFLGDWQGQDGSTLSIRADGTGDYRSGGKKVEGGTAEVDESAKTISITFFGIGETLTINEPPQGDAMKLNGITYRRKGGFTTDSNTDKKDLKSKDDSKSDENKTKVKADKDMPSEEDIEALVRDTLSQFNDAIESEDFSDFHSNTSKDFQATYTAAQMKTTFQGFIDKKSQVNPILNQVSDLTPDYTTEPNVTTEKGYKLLNIDGNYATSPSKTSFELQYELEKKVWKLLKIRVKFQ